MMEEKFSFKKGNRSRAIFLIFAYIFLILTLLCVIVPLLKVISDSLDPTSSSNIRFFPKTFDFSAYIYILTKPSLSKPLFVSVFTTILGTIVGLLIVTVSAYVIIQHEMPGRKLFVNIILFTMLFNGGLIPTFLTVKSIGLMNSYWAVIIPVTLSAYNIILMKSFFESIPSTLYEAAELDGCSPFGTFWRIVIPLSKPAIASVGLFIAVALWNDFFHFQMFIPDSTRHNLQMKLREMIISESEVGAPTTSGFTTEMIKSAIVVVVIAPFMVIYPFLQKYFVKGVTVGAVKG